MRTNTIYACLAGHTQAKARPLRLLLPRPACLWQVMVALAALAFGPQPTQAAVTEAWVHRFSNVLSNSVDRSLKVLRDAEGDIIVTGTSDDNTSGPDILTIKYSGADGSVIWQQRQRYGASPDDGNYSRGAIVVALAVALAVDGSGNVVVTGSTVDTDNNSVSGYYTAKYAAATGSVLWEKRYHSDGQGASAVTVDGSGNVVVTGSAATLKYAAADGALLWENRSAAGNIALAVDAHGNVMVTGSFHNATNNNDYYTAKYGAVDGALIWEKRYDSPVNGFDTPYAVAVDGSGNVVVTGSTATLKYGTADGALLWEKSANFANPYYLAAALAVNGNGNVVVAGSSYKFDLNNADYYTAKYAAADGVLLWEKRDNYGHAQAVALDASGNVVVTGVSFSEIPQGGIYLPHFYTVKYAGVDGALLWERRSNSQAFFISGYYLTDAAAVVVDGSGDVIMTGHAFGDQGRSDYYTAKYAAADGALLWEQRYNGPAHHESHPNAVAMDRSGNVLVTATSGRDFYTAKYAASNGALLWEKRGPGSLAQVVVDDSGNVVVTGSSSGGTGDLEYYTAKYAAGGALLWEKRYNGPTGRENSATAVAFDASGNVVVTGSSDGISGFGNNSDYYTAKYAAADGALLWEKRYNGPGNGYDQARAVVVDGDGNIVVTGSSAASASISGRHDYYTAKYAGVDGALLWEKRYNGSASSDEPGRAVAVDVTGNVVVMGFTATLKYAGADGALLWVKRYSDTYALAVDDVGSVLVTGTSGTLKLAAADGALLWQKRFTGGGRAVALDASGNVVVTGNSYNDQRKADYYTVKYAAADGALLWEKQYNSAANGYDEVGAWHSLAVGPNGMVAVTGSSYLGISSGGTSIGSDVLTVVYREALSAVVIEQVPSGIRLSFTGTAGQSYSIQRAPAVSGPWRTINTQTASASGLLEYLDTSPHRGSGFYRTVQP